MEWQRCTLRTAIQTPRPGSAPCRAVPGRPLALSWSSKKPAALDQPRCVMAFARASAAAWQVAVWLGNPDVVQARTRLSSRFHRRQFKSTAAEPVVRMLASASFAPVQHRRGTCASQKARKSNPDRTLHRTHAVAISVKARHGGNAQIQDGPEHTGRAPGDAERPALRYSWPAMGFYNPHRR